MTMCIGRYLRGNSVCMAVVRWLYCCALLCVAAASAHSQAPIDTVFAFRPGSGQNAGQSAPYFPGNILGVPDTAARYDVPAVRPEHICSLGMGGEIVVGFRSAVIRDREGPDFVIFENAFFTSLGGGRIYAEPGRVAVSRDGVHFVEFPFDSLTLRGCAGHTPTIGNVNPYDAAAGGDAFDLADIGMDSVRFIRITDISEMVKNNPKHPNWDPTISGFDLDAVLALHLDGHDGAGSRAQPVLALAASRIDVVLPYGSESGELRLFTVDGRLAGQWQWAGRTATLLPRALVRGAYLAAVRFGNQYTTFCLFYEP